MVYDHFSYPMNLLNHHIDTPHTPSAVLPGPNTVKIRSIIPISLRQMHVMVQVFNLESPGPF